MVTPGHVVGGLAVPSDATFHRGYAPYDSAELKHVFGRVEVNASKSVDDVAQRIFFDTASVYVRVIKLEHYRIGMNYFSYCHVNALARNRKCCAGTTSWIE